MLPRRVPDAPYPEQSDRRAVADGLRISRTELEFDEDGLAYERITAWDFECGCTETMVLLDCSNPTHPQEHPAYDGT